MSALSAVILGLIQGIAEFLPISSSGHLSVVQNLFGLNTVEEGHLFFDVLLHFGTLVSICVYYRKDISKMMGEIIRLVDSLRGKSGAKVRGKDKGSAKGGGVTPERRLVFMIITATLPLFAVLPFQDQIEKLYYSTIFIGIALLLTGCMLFVSDRMATGEKTEKNMKVSDALIVGVCQAIAIIPGLSRSGTTITAGLATGQSREYAVRFSFLMSLPAVLGANLLSLVKAMRDGFDFSLMPTYLLGMAVAAVSGYFAIGLVKLIASKAKFGYFAYYCWTAGFIAIVLSLIK